MAQITLSVTLAVTVAVAQVPNEQDVAPGATINLDAGDTPCWAGGSHSCTQFRGQSDAWVAPVSPANYSGLTDGSHTFSLVGQISGGRRATRFSTHGWWTRCLRQCLWLPRIPPIRPSPPMQPSLSPMRSRASPSCAAWMVPRRIATGSQPTWGSLMVATHSLLLQRTPPEIKAWRACSVGRSTPRPRRLRTSTAHPQLCRIRFARICVFGCAGWCCVHLPIGRGTASTLLFAGNLCRTGRRNSYIFSHCQRPKFGQIEHAGDLCLDQGYNASRRKRSGSMGRWSSPQSQSFDGGRMHAH